MEYASVSKKYENLFWLQGRVDHYGFVLWSKIKEDAVYFLKSLSNSQVKAIAVIFERSVTHNIILCVGLDPQPPTIAPARMTNC